MFAGIFEEFSPTQPSSSGVSQTLSESASVQELVSVQDYSSEDSPSLTITLISLAPTSD